MLYSKDGSIDNKGSNNLNNTGANAHIGDIYNNYPKPLNRTYLYDFCVRFADIDDSYEYSTEFASSIDGKIKYNEISVYKIVFLTCDHYLDDVELILMEIPKRERILSKINIKYEKLKASKAWDNKDDLCEQIYNYLYETVESDHNSSNIVKEDVEVAIHSLMYYAFVKCKLLDPIP